MLVGDNSYSDLHNLVLLNRAMKLRGEDVLCTSSPLNFIAKISNAHCDVAGLERPYRKQRRGRQEVRKYWVMGELEDICYRQDLRTDHEKPSGWTIFGGAPRPQKSSNCVSPDRVAV